MRKLFNKLKSLDKRLKFIMVGGLNTAVSTVVDAAVILLVFGIPLGLAKAQATPGQALIGYVVGYAAGMVNAFFWNKYFTFQTRGRTGREVWRFVLVSAVQFGVNYGLQLLLQKVTGIYVAKIAATVVTVALSYFANNYFTFYSGQKDKPPGGAGNMQDTDNTQDTGNVQDPEPEP